MIGFAVPGLDPVISTILPDECGCGGRLGPTPDGDAICQQCGFIWRVAGESYWLRCDSTPEVSEVE